MNNKINKFTIILLVLMVAIPFFSFNVGATESVVYASGSTLVINPSTSMVVDQDGDLWCVCVGDGANCYYYVYKSADNGVTWGLNYSLTSIGNGGNGACAIGVNDDNDIYVFYVHADAQGYPDVKYRCLSGDSWSGEVKVHDVSSQKVAWMDVTFDDDNMYFVWTEYGINVGSNHVYFKSYNFVLETWGTRITLETTSGLNCRIEDVSICLYGSDIYVFYYDTSYRIEYAQYHNHNTTWTTSHILTDSAIYRYYEPSAIVVNNKIWVFYRGNCSTQESGTSILYKTYTGSWSSESVLHGDTGYNQIEPTASANIDGTINVVWSGKSVLSSVYYQLRQRVYDGSNWGDTAFISSGSTNKRYAHLCFQEYPTFTHLSEGVSINYFDDSQNDVEYIDSGSLIWYSGGDGEYSGDFEFDANNNIGNLDTGCIMGVAYKDVEFKYQVPITINATGFDLLVSSDQHGYASDLSNYDLYINGDPMGNPTEWKEYSNKYVLRWTFADEKVITNTEILFEVWHDQLVSAISYWYLGVSCGYNDLDGDGIATMRYSNTYPNGVFDGTWLAKDVAYQLYYNVIQFIEDETPIDYNTISATNTTYYVGESVPLTYTIKSSDLVYDNHVRIWNDDTATEITTGSMQGFPYLCTHQVETIGFVPFTSANYTAHLYINDVETDNVSFFVDEHINSEMYVFTYPNPSKVGQKIWVSYKFDHPTGKDGAIFLCKSPNLNSYESVNYLSDGDQGFWTRTFDTIGIYYFIMAVDINGNGTYGIVNDGVKAHYVRSEHGNNYFTLGGYNLRLNEQGTVTQIASGECNMVSGNVFLYDNNQLVKTITESPFSYNYDIHTAGLHTVEMRLITNVTTVLCTQNYTVSTYTGEEDIEQVEDSGYVIRDYIYNEWGDFGIFIAGVSIILGFMFIPFALVLYVNVKFNKNIAIGDLHWSTYLIFAIVGVIVVVMLHLADLWIVLLICVVSIAIAVITYSSNK